MTNIAAIARKALGRDDSNLEKSMEEDNEQLNFDENIDENSFVRIEEQNQTQ